MVKTHGKTILKTLALFAALSGGIILLTDAASNQVNAEETTVVSASVAVEAACTLGVENTEHTATITPGSHTEGIGGDTIFTINCNDMDGYVVYAVGYSNDKEGTTAMVGSGTAEGYNIAAGTATGGSNSNWSFKVQTASSDTEGIVLPASNGAFMAIPDTRTAVMQRETGISSSGGDKFNVNYAVYVSDAQVAGTYTGKVKYILFQPHSHNPYTLQSASGWADSVEMGQTITAIDERDGNSYMVRKLADGNLWMVENLRLGGDQPISLSPADSDVANEFILPAIGTGEPDSYDEARVDVDSQWGGYYNWYTATAGTGTTAIAVDGTNASSSICPKGWRLPTGGTDGEFHTLAAAYGGTDSAASEALHNNSGPNFVYSGYYYGSKNVSYGQGSYGSYWSSTAYNFINAYDLDFNNEGINATGSSGSSSRRSVRCVLREKSKTMQTVNEWKDSVEEGQTATAVDERDGNIYRVRRLADGKLWMVDNLRLGDGELKDRALTSANTDLNDGLETYDLPESSKEGFSGNTAENIYVVEADSGNELKAYGGYYTWNVATAGTGAKTANGNNASSSICPKGWRLPTASSRNSEFADLNDALGSVSGSNKVANWINPDGPAFLLSGNYYSGSARNQGNYGYYWSSTSYDSSNAYLMYFYSASVYPSGNNYRYLGLSVRCLAE